MSASVRNRLLCSLLRPEPWDLMVADWPEAESPEDRLLLAMHLVATARTERLAGLLRAPDDLPWEGLARYGLFLALTRDAVLGLRALETMSRLAPQAGPVWSALALLYALRGQALASARAAAVHAALTGRAADLALPVAAPARGGASPIRFLNGDVRPGG